jgi:DAK2 domain fusion protein YloV
VTIEELHELRAPELQELMRRYLGLLQVHRDSLNRLNVYPVPDGDTGTNMAKTMESVVEALRRASGMPDTAGAIAHGSLMGAQGNSGIILSQVLRAVAAIVERGESLDGEGLVEGCRRAAEAAYTAVGRPVEGTILTVIREVSGALAGADGAPLPQLAGVAYREAEASLRRTPALLPVLAEAGVVDAGGAGLLLLFASLHEMVTGTLPTLPGDLLSATADTARLADPSRGGRPSVADLRYEVMFLLEGPEGAGDRLRQAWEGIGDSIVVVGNGGIWNCHIHTDHIGAAIEAGIAAGRPSRIVVADLLEQVADERIHARPVFEPRPDVVKARVGVIAVAAGDGVIDLFRELGCQGVVTGGQTMNPSVGDLLAAVDAAPGRTIIVLPNNKNVIPAAEELDSLTRKKIHVIPTRSVPHGIAAVFAYAPDQPAEVSVEAMTAAAGGLTSGELTRAVREASTPAGRIHRGDWLGLVDGKVQVITASGEYSSRRRRIEGWLLGKARCRRRQESRVRRSERAALLSLLQRVIVGHHELVTLVLGRDATPAVVEAAAAWIASAAPEVDLHVVEGGQPLYPYLVGAE